MHGTKLTLKSSHLIFACASVDGHCTGHAAGMKGPQAVAVRQVVEVGGGGSSEVGGSSEDGGSSEGCNGRIDIQSMVFHPNITF